MTVQSQVAKAQEAVQKEQDIGAKLQQELAAVRSGSQRQVDLQKERAEAAEREKQLVEQSLAAEQRKVPCTFMSYPCHKLLYGFVTR